MENSVKTRVNPKSGRDSNYRAFRMGNFQLVFWIDSSFGEVTKQRGFVALKILFLRYIENVFVFKKINGLIFKPDKSACKACTFETSIKSLAYRIFIINKRSLFN